MERVIKILHKFGEKQVKMMCVTIEELIVFVKQESSTSDEPAGLKAKKH